MLRWFAPAGLAVLVMLPRLASARFGLLDDGLTLQTGREVIGRWSSVLDLIPETGRFFPAYWLAYSGVFALVGVRAAAFFALNVLLLAGLLALLARIVRASGGTSRQAALAAVLFALCAPAIEAFYTLSKAEPLQLTWICASLLTTAAAVRESWWWRRGVLIGLAVAALVLAYATKETTAILVPVSLAWAAIEWWAGRQPGWTRFANTYVVVTGAAAAVFIVLRWRYAALPLAEGTYTRAYALEPGALAAAMFRISAWMARDFAFLLPLLAAAIVLVLRGGPDRRRQILYACAWMGGWLAVYAPWPATFAYYLLPFAFGAAILAGIVIGALWELGVSGAPVLTRRLARAALVVSGLLWLPAVINAAADARVQLAVDRANADLVDFLGGVPGGSRVVVNTTRVNEYLYELPLHLAEIKRRPDLVVQRAGLHDGAARPSPGSRDPPATLPRGRPAVHRHDLLPEPSRSRRCPHVQLWMAGPPARAPRGRARPEPDMTMAQRRLAIDIVVPVYNEEAIVAEFHRRLMDVVTPLRREHDVRICYVNDGSVDHTAAELVKAAGDDGGVTILELSRNFGHQAALTAGLDHAEGDAVVTLDGDGQHPPELIADMVALYQAGYEVVLTQRVGAELPAFKRWTSAAFYRLLSVIGNTRIIAASADFRLLSRPVLQALRQMREYHRFLRGMVAWTGYRTVVLPYTERARLGGTAKYSLRRMGRLAAEATFSFSLVPLKIALVVGLGFLALAVAEALYVLSFWLTGRQHLLVPGWASLMFMLLIVGSALMIALGLVGIYVGYIFQEVKRRPVYLIRTVHGDAGDAPPDAAHERER